MIESVWQDLHYAARVLGRNRLFASAAIGTLAVAIGANTAIFSLIDAAFLRPLPYPVHGELAGSSGHRSLVQAPAVLPPPVGTETS